MNDSDDHGREAASRPCYHCGAAAADTWLTYEADQRFDIVTCRRCGFLFTRELPSTDELMGFYQENYYREDDCGRFLQPVERVISAFRRRRVDMIRKWIGPPPGRVLDIGCGRGLFLAHMKSAGYEAFGTQFSRPAANFIQQRYGIDVFVGELADSPYADSSFDLITLWHVLEHTRDPAEYLRRIRRLLKPGGHLFIEVPNAGCLTARWARGAWLHFDLPRHLAHFTSDHLGTLLGETGFVIDRKRTFSLEYGPFGVVQSLLNMASARRNYLYDGLSTGANMLSPGRLAHAGVAGLLAAPAFLYCAAAASAGDGDILSLWCRTAGD